MDSKKKPGSRSFPDLHEFPAGSLPSPVQMMNPVRRLPPGVRLVAVGWLDGSSEFPTGATDCDVVSRVLDLGDEFLISEGCGETQICGYCEPEVVAAVLSGVFLADGDLVHTGEDFLVTALQPLIAAAELAENRELAETYRARIAARREQIRVPDGV